VKVFFSGTFVSDTSGTFECDTTGSFVSDTGGTFGVILSERIYFNQLLTRSGPLSVSKNCWLNFSEKR